MPFPRSINNIDMQYESVAYVIPFVVCCCPSSIFTGVGGQSSAPNFSLPYIPVRDGCQAISLKLVPIGAGRPFGGSILICQLLHFGVSSQYGFFYFLFPWCPILDGCQSGLPTHTPPHPNFSLPSIPIGDGFQYGAFVLFPIGAVCSFGWSKLICRLFSVG